MGDNSSLTLYCESNLEQVCLKVIVAITLYKIILIGKGNQGRVLDSLSKFEVKPIHGIDLGLLSSSHPCIDHLHVPSISVLR